MILRRVITHFRKQEWTAIAIDFVIVVVGVFIGIQVSNWNETRVERTREVIFLTNLAKDVRRDIVDINVISRVSTQRMSALGFLVRSATGSELPDGFASARGQIEIEETPLYAATDPTSIPSVHSSNKSSFCTSYSTSPSL